MLALISIFLTVAINPVRGQSAAGVWQSLKRLNTTATVLHTTAHPDDEDGALLTWLSRGQGIRTGLFSLTRGEGGANLNRARIVRCTWNTANRRVIGSCSVL